MLGNENTVRSSTGMLKRYRFIILAMIFWTIGPGHAYAVDIEKTCGKIIRLKADDTAKIINLLEDELELKAEDSSNLVQLIMEKLADQENNTAIKPYEIDDCILDIKSTSIQ